MKDIDDIRRDNLRILEQELGGSAAAARTLNMSPAQFINLRAGAKDSRTGRRRGMRKDTARRIEELAGKPTGWLDIDHSYTAPSTERAGSVREEPAAYGAGLSPRERALIENYRALDDHAKSIVEATATQAAKPRKKAV